MSCIHIIEDDRDLLALIRYHLLSRGFDVCDDYNGDMFVAGGEDKSDLYLVDVNLDNRSGTDLCEKIRKNHLKPVILMSANEHLQAMAALCGAESFIRKPFHFEELLVQIIRFIPPPVVLSKGA